MIAEQAVQCGYCYNGHIIKGAELLFKNPQPTEAQIRSAMNGHIVDAERIRGFWRPFSVLRRRWRFGDETPGRLWSDDTPAWSVGGARPGDDVDDAGAIVQSDRVG